LATNSVGSSSERTCLRIPATVRVGVTGHRTFADDQLLRRKVRKVLEMLDGILAHTPHDYVVVSPLAEGADRLVAKEILNWRGAGTVGKSSLEAVLPLPESRYIDDFKTVESRDEFERLLSAATSKHVLSDAASRSAAYEQVGRYVVDNCDLLVAVWNGRTSEGPGGTAEIVGYACRAGRSIFWIDSETGAISDTKKTRKRIRSLREPERGETADASEGGDHALGSLRNLDAYNGELSAGSRTASDVEAEFGIPGPTGKSYDLAQDILQPLRGNLLPQYARADSLAARYQARHVNAGIAVYALAAGAVATVTAQVLFLPRHTWLLWLEVLEMAAILAVLAFSWHGQWHRKWIDYRFLAERLRAAVFLWAAGIECEPPKPAPHLGLSHRPDDWMVRAFAWIWSARPATSPCPALPFETLKTFLASAWIGGQISFYRRKSSRQRARHGRLALAGAIVFGLTLIVAIVHAARLEARWRPEPAGLTSFLAFLAIVLPAAGAAVASIRVHREYLRNSERYRQMADHLAGTTAGIERASSTQALTRCLQEANELMLLENQDWRVIFRFQQFGP